MHQELTYLEIYETTSNIWSMLFTTGYLIWRGKADDFEWNCYYQIYRKEL